MQALGYLMVYMAKGSLPWQKVKAKNQPQKYKRIFEIKDSYTPEALCDGLPGKIIANNMLYRGICTVCKSCKKT